MFFLLPNDSHLYGVSLSSPSTLSRPFCLYSDDIANMSCVLPIAMLPVRWISPESLVDGVFTTKSDVWSLGVTLWELATFGSFPYQGFSNGEVVERVKQGRIMDTPQGCANELYVLTVTFLSTVLSMYLLCFASVEKSFIR